MITTTRHSTARLSHWTRPRLRPPRLFERGYEIHEAQQFTLHSSWQQLLRYTHLRPEQIADLPYPSAALAE